MTPCPSGPAWADAEPGSGFFFASNARMGRWAPPGAAIFHVAASELSCAGMVRTTEPAQEPETKNLKLGSKMDPRITKSSMNPLRLATGDGQSAEKARHYSALGLTYLTLYDPLRSHISEITYLT